MKVFGNVNRHGHSGLIGIVGLVSQGLNVEPSKTELHQATGEFDEAIAPHVGCYSDHVNVRVVFPFEEVSLAERK